MPDTVQFHAERSDLAEKQIQHRKRNGPTINNWSAHVLVVAPSNAWGMHLVCRPEQREGPCTIGSYLKGLPLWLGFFGGAVCLSGFAALATAAATASPTVPGLSLPVPGRCAFSV